MTLFRLDTSIFPGASASVALGDIVEREWRTSHPDASIVRRDIAGEPIASDAWPNALSAGMTPESERTEGQRAALELSSTLADELLEADALLFTVPLYNYGVSQHFKTWFDLAYADSRIDAAAAPTSALRGKPAVLATVLGGNYSPGTPKEGWDHSTGWLTRVLGDVWGLDLKVVKREFTLVGVNPALDAFAEAGAALKTAAEQLAAEHGRHLAAAMPRVAA